MTQKQAVLNYLRQRPITSFEAFAELGVTRLARIIFNLRKDGNIIEGDDVVRKNRYGQTVRFTRYILKAEVK